MKLFITITFVFFLSLSVNPVKCQVSEENSDTLISKGYLDKISEHEQTILNLEASCPEPCTDTAVLKQIAAYLSTIGVLYSDYASISTALDYYEKSIAIQQRINDKEGLASTYNNIGSIYVNLGDQKKGLFNYHKSIKLKEETHDTAGLAYSYSGIAVIYHNNGDLENSLKYYQKSSDICEKNGNYRVLGDNYWVIANIYLEQGAWEEYRKAIEKSREAYKLLQDDYGMGSFYFVSGDIEYYSGNFSSAANLYKKALPYYRNVHLDYMGWTYRTISNCYVQTGELGKAKKMADSALIVAKEIGYPLAIRMASSLCKNIMVAQGDFKKAFYYFEQEVLMKDSIQNENSARELQMLQVRFDFQRQRAIDSVAFSKAIQIKDLELQKQHEENEKKEAINQRQTVVIYSFIAGFVIILIFSFLLLKMFIQKKKANKLLAYQNDQIKQKNEEITTQRDEIEAQRDEVQAQKEIVEFQKEEMEDSIHYAQRIQNAVLPAEDFANTILDDYFILFRPKDVVSGDFYWAAKQKNGW